MSDTKIIQELIDIVVLDGRLKKDLEGFWMQKKEGIVQKKPDESWNPHE